MATTCPLSGKPGRRVPDVTLRSLVRDDRQSEVQGREWYYCDSPDCEVVYFAADGRTLRKDALKVRVGAKEKTSPRTVCYCFGHSVESICDEVARTFESTVAASIAAKVKAGECRCEILNPKGACCLGDVKKAVKDAFAGVGGEPSPGAEEPEHDCCAVVAPPRPERAGILAAGASVLAAIAASACCWLPLLLVAVGASAAGVSAAFERARPFFLVLAPIFLGAGFYFAYFRRQVCAPGDACAAPGRRLRRFNRAMLWVASVVVIAVAFFPNYVGLLLRRGPKPAGAAGTGSTQTMTLRIEGMTCEACAPHVEAELASVPGVRRATVLYAEGRAVVAVDATHPPDPAMLVSAVEKAGYSAQFAPGR
ncbi:MAG: cation transporter [Planctomycetes bacterium]|nr:cation transporter [Planctomycetota bacterium]